jgi:hypothetical protein
MKTLILILFSSACYAQGTCGTAVNIPLDGVCYTYPGSTTTGPAADCNYTETGKITYFKFTPATSGCIEFKITTSDGTSMEATVYSNSSNCGGLLDAHTICFNDGVGTWAPNLYSRLTAGKVYIMKLWKPSTFTGSFEICAKYNTPANTSCGSAMPIGTTNVTDNNWCHTPDYNILPYDLCAFTIENTAWYAYTVQSTGISSITIANIQCDNYTSNSNGFQIGLFTGTCVDTDPNNHGLTPIACEAGYGEFAAFTPTLPAGTLVYVGIDGVSGANCKYTLSGFNVEPLPIRPTIPYQRKNLVYSQGGVLTVQTQRKAKVEVYNTVGQLVYVKEVNGIMTYSGASGLYIVRVIEGAHEILKKKIYL